MYYNCMLNSFSLKNTNFITPQYILCWFFTFRSWAFNTHAYIQSCHDWNDLSTNANGYSKPIVGRYDECINIHIFLYSDYCPGILYLIA